MKQANLRIYRMILPLLLGLFLSLNAFAQQVSVKGHVKDTTGEPVIGANVLVQGTSHGTITDFDGNFTLNVPQNATLVVTFVGYKQVEVKAEKTMLITLQDDSQLLDAVVVIGYGTMKKSDLSGSVVSVKAEEMNKGAITSPQELLQGKVSGLFVSPPSGGPGESSTIRIRGGASLNASNDPLVVIDGVPVANDAAPGMRNPLSTVNPNDIESMTVLKDASATAIYGSRASNGVIIITTKKGSQGGVKVAYTSTYSMNDPYNRVKVYDADEFRESIAKHYPSSTDAGKNAQKLLDMFPDQSTNWQDKIFQKGLGTDQNISVSGKTGILPYRVSFGYNNENGTIKTSNYERYTAGVNLNPKFFNDHLSVTINVKGSINNNKFADAGVVGAAAFYDPTKPIYSSNGYYNGFYNSMQGNQPNKLASVNPYSILYDNADYGKTKRSIGNLQLDYKMHFLPELRANLNVGYDIAKGEGYNGPNIGSFQSAKDSDFPNIGQHKEWNNFRKNQLLDFYLNYAKDFEKIQSRLDVMGGYSWQHFYSSDYDLLASNLMDNPYTTDPAGWQWDQSSSMYIKDGSFRIPKENYLVSFFGRLNYTFMERYLLTATIRQDGSSRFAKDNRWGLFPSGAFAWTISNEPFMERFRNLSSLKLRAGYGVTGQQDLGKDYAYIPSYHISQNPNSTYLGSYLIKPGGYNKNLKWEQTATANIALDFGLYNNRFNGTIELYEKRTKDLLNTVATPAGTNFVNEIIANVGEMRNRGIEFNINAVAIQTKDWKWDLGYNITWNDSEITKLTTSNNPDYPGINTGGLGYGTGSTIQKHMVGYAPSTFFVYEQVYDVNGKPIQNTLVDRNGDGEITEADRYLAKSPMAKVYMGLSSMLTWRNVDFGFNLRANIGNYMFNAFAADNASPMNFNNQGFLTNQYKTAIDRSGFSQISTLPQKMSDYFLENASFLRMDNITVGYSFDKLFTNKLSGRISFAVQNVFTVTKYSGLDPEGSGIDGSVWPRPRTYTLGLNLNF